MEVWRDDWALWRHDARRRYARWAERVWMHRRELRRWACVLVAGCLAAVWAMGWWTSRPDAYVPDMAWARHGEPGVDFHAVSRDVQCRELDDGLLQPEGMLTTRVQQAMERVIADELPCVCAPMFAVQRRWLVIGTAEHNVHMVNPVLDPVPDDVSRSWVPESQRMLMPARTDQVEHVRADVVTVQYRTLAGCTAAAATVHREAAWCVQTCVDLMDGRTVYDSH